MVCVAETEPGNGLAAAMFDALQRHMGDRPATTFVRADNAPSLRAHQKMGMRELGTFMSDSAHLRTLLNHLKRGCYVRE